MRIMKPIYLVIATTIFLLIFTYYVIFRTEVIQQLSIRQVEFLCRFVNLSRLKEWHESPRYLAYLKTGSIFLLLFVMVLIYVIYTYIRLKL